jgi:hypothetical protein
MTIDLPRSNFYCAIKFMRRRVGISLDQKAHIWPTAKQTFLRWTTALENKGSTTIIRHQTTQEKWAVFSDASDQGFGVVIITPMTTHITAGKWSPDETQRHITWKEAVALYEACILAKLVIQQTRPRLPPHIHFYIDNTSVLGAVNNGCSKSYQLNHVVHKILTLNIVKHMSYVASAKNIADLPSRLEYEGTAAGSMFRTSFLHKLIQVDLTTGGD